MTKALRISLPGSIFMGLLLLAPVSVRAQDAPAPVAGQQPNTEGEARKKAAELRRAQHDMHEDFAGLRKYAQEDVELADVHPASPRVIFMGDSITAFWGRPGNGFFTDDGYINRGIGGQTTSQMLLRFRQDVIALSPQVVVILAGTNDIAANTGLISVHDIENNLKSMMDLAIANHIKVVLCTLLPAMRYPWRPEIEPHDQIAALNDWIRQYGEGKHLNVVDLYGAMANPDGSMKALLSNEGVHPNPNGYTVMKPLVQAGIQKALR